MPPMDTPSCAAACLRSHVFGRTNSMLLPPGLVSPCQRRHDEVPLRDTLRRRVSVNICSLALSNCGWKLPSWSCKCCTNSQGNEESFEHLLCWLLWSLQGAMKQKKQLWIACDHCDIWYHCLCEELVHLLAQTEKYVCQMCQASGTT